MNSAEKLKTYCVFFPRVTMTTADALYDSAWKLTMSHKFNEVLRGIFESDPDPFALEIFYSNQTFSLCFTANGSTAYAIHGSLMQIFPFADVREIPDPLENISQDSVISVTDVTYGKSDIYPSLNYRDTMCDPIAPIVNAISQVDSDHITVLQVALRRLRCDWKTYALISAMRLVDRIFHFARVKYWLK